MGFLKKMDRAGGLFNGMADRVGADIEAKIIADPERAVAYRSAILRCANCAEPDSCEGWQAEHERADHAPSYCRNHDALKAMRDI